MKKSDIIKSLLDEGKSVEEIALELECKESVVKAVRTKYNKEKEADVEDNDQADDSDKDDAGDLPDNEDISPEIMETVEVLDEVLEVVSEPDVEELPDVEAEETEVVEVDEEDLALEVLENRLRKRGLHIKKRKIKRLRRLIKVYKSNRTEAAWKVLSRGYHRYKKALSTVPEVKELFENLAKKEGRK